MEIKVGFVHSPRELSVNTEGEQADLVSRLQGFLDGDDRTTVVEDTKGSRHILVREQVAYIEVGTSSPRTVGFI
ncbi:DUF3107 domain-containing protein [Corynebacterium bovis]|uniref:DUF3107 domain-containing protein n=1 Tax=Corynebacterium bovis TaxID=36808 RepID=UPI00244779B8|nr:DUF3107 domain-containing protein [Corynebacterium bovis]MDH2455495.1 DUF3107 domain-containing protein [Corynebacterium bovis]MDK8511145.1 DUF3107 domain-containing protein [Corynebacterium bovis]